MTPKDNNFLGELRFGHRYSTSAPLIGLGLGIITTLFFALAPLILQKSNLNSIFWGMIMGGLIFLITILNVVELLAGSGEKGGTYILVQETIGGFSAFITGWSMLIGATAIGSSLLRETANILINTIESPYFTENSKITVLLFYAGLVIFQIAPKPFRRGRRRSITTILLLIFLVFIISIFFNGNYQLKQADWAYSSSSEVFQITAWITIIYIAFETILSARSQTQSPIIHISNSLFWVLAVGIIGGIVTFAATRGMVTTTPVSLQQILTAGSLLPDWLVNIFVFLIIWVGMDSIFRVSFRQVHLFSRHGAFPLSLIKTHKKTQVPPGIYVFVSAIFIPMLVWFPSQQAIELGSEMFLVAMFFINLAAMYSRYREPDRRRSITLPLNPVIPMLGISICFGLFSSLLPRVITLFSVWFIIGTVIYFVYARRGQAAALIGETIFGSEHPVEKKQRYRILLPLRHGEERRMLLNLAISLARQVNGEIIPLQVVRVPDPLAIEQGKKLAREQNEMFQWSMRVAQKLNVPIYPITRLARSVSDGIIDTAIEEECDLVILAWDKITKSPRQQFGSILDPVLRGVQCDVAVIAYRPGSEFLSPQTEEPSHLKRILVPTAGGPHAPLAIQLSLLLTREYNATVEAVYIAPIDATSDEIADGEARIDQTIAALRAQEAQLLHTGESLDEIQIEGKVHPAPNVIQGIVSAGDKSDLIMIGASEESLLDQVLFGNLPEQVARKSSAPVIMVKRFRGIRRFWLQRIFNTIFETLPTLSRQAQSQVLRNLQQGARPDIDYFVLIGLSTLIATFGLLQNSTAVIIGAMLVAPLFTPLMAVSLAIAQGNIRLLRTGLEATIKGVLLAIGLAIFLAYLVPIQSLTTEIIGRTTPNLIDLGVALAAGIVGAYAIARKEVAAALPGVAIAAALVPPLGVIGIGLAIGDLSVSGGATLLVATNLIAIAFAGALTLIMLGFRPIKTYNIGWFRQGLFSALILFILITLPLGVFGYQSFQETQNTQKIQKEIVEITNEYPSIELTNQDDITLVDHNDYFLITIPIYMNTNQPPEDLADQLENKLSLILEKDVKIRLVLYSIIESP